MKETVPVDDGQGPAATEHRRLAELRRLGVLDTLPEPVFDAITQTAAELCGVPIALLSLIDVDRQWFKSNHGLAGVTQTARDVAFCDHVIRHDELMEVRDAQADPRFADNPFVTGDPNIRFYAGAPIVMAGGERIGTVCVIDHAPRQLSEAQRRTLAGLGRIASACLEDRRQRLNIAADLAVSESRYRAIADNVPAMLTYWDQDGINRFANREYQAAVGLPLAQIIGRPLREVYDSVDPAGYAALAPRIAEVLQGRRQVFEHGLLSVAGLRQVHMTYVPDRRDDGSVAGFYGLAYDITGRKALELRLGDSEGRYRSLVEHLNCGVALHEIVLDAQGRPVDYRVLAMNQAFSELTGLDATQSIGRCITELPPGIDNDPADSIRLYGQVAISGVGAHVERYAPTLERWFDIVAYRVSPGQFGLIVNDITPRKDAEAGRARPAVMPPTR